MAEIAVRTIRCDSCGASITGISSWKPTVCDYCGSEVIVELPPEQASAVVDRPRCVAFRIDAAQAAERLRDWLKASFWAPGDLAASARTEEQSQVYAPAWEVRVDVESDWKGADSDTRYRTVTKTRTDAQTGRQETYQDSEPYTVWTPLSGEHNASYAEVINASGALTQDEVSALTPWDTGDQEDLAEALNQGRRMEEPTMSEDEATRRAREIVEQKERTACEQLADRIDGVSVEFGEFITQRVIVPVWVFRYRYKGNNQRAVMNGQTGELHGQRPVSPIKVALAIGIPAVIVIGIILVSVFMR
jgi:DNA-directed RNA polymerase subunit RPC12/RpoP